MKILIAGATSSIAKIMAEKFACSGHEIYLAGRQNEEIKRISHDISIRCRTRVETGHLNIHHYDSHKELVAQSATALGGLDLILMAIGELVEQDEAEKDFACAASMINSNYTGCVSFLNAAADFFKSQKSGTIIGISSVAGERGRQSNFIYGSAKAGLTAYLSGLRNSLFADNVHVMTVKLGVVDTKMSYGKSRLLFPVTAETAATDIIKALEQKHDIVFVPWFWRWIMMIICSVPEHIFKRLKL